MLSCSVWPLDQGLGTVFEEKTSAQKYSLFPETKVNTIKHTKQQIIDSHVPQRSTQWLLMSKYILRAFSAAFLALQSEGLLSFVHHYYKT